MKTAAPKAEAEKEEVASSFHDTAEKFRRMWSVTAKAEKETQEGEMNSQGTD